MNLQAPTGTVLVQHADEEEADCNQFSAIMFSIRRSRRVQRIEFSEATGLWRRSMTVKTCLLFLAACGLVADAPASLAQTLDLDALYEVHAAEGECRPIYRDRRRSTPDL